MREGFTVSKTDFEPLSSYLSSDNRREGRGMITHNHAVTGAGVTTLPLPGRDCGCGSGPGIMTAK